MKNGCVGGNTVSYINFKVGYSNNCTDKKHCVCWKISRELTLNSTLEKYGVKYPLQSDFFKNKIKQTNLERYGVTHVSKLENIKEKKIETNRNRRGVDNSFQCENVKEKIKQANLEKYGVEFASQSTEFKEKVKLTNNIKYNTNNTFQCENVKEKIKQANLEKYGVKHNSQKHLKDIIHLIESQDYWNKFNSYQEIKDELLDRLSTSTLLIYTHKYRPDIEVNTLISTPHKIINEFLDTLNIEYVINTRKVISPVELDIYIPDYNLAIEINGVYWHSEEKGKDEKYHLNKLLRCEEKEIDLIHLTDVDILTKQDIVFNLIKEKLNLNEVININYCTIIDLDRETSIDFINKNSLHEYKESNIHKGLMYNNKLVSIICLKKLNKQFNYIVTNFTTKLEYDTDNLIHLLIKDIKGIFVVDVDRNMFNNNIFTENWNLLTIIPPKFKYFNKNINLTKKQNFEIKLWDTGSKRYTFTNI